MTRENKLALVIGFALILFVGILISDHFSVARLSETAALDESVVDPLVQTGRNQSDLVEYQMLNRPTTLPPSNPTDLGGGGAPREMDETAVYMGTAAQRNPGAIGLEETSGDAPAFIFHDVRPGESLSSIAKRYYGDSYNAAELARFNHLDNPNQISAGHRLRIPTSAPAFAGGGAVQPGESAANATPPVAPSVSEFARYTVKSGDVLSKLASEFMGTSRRTNELYELNRDVISNPDRLITGTVIKVPKE